MTSRLTATAADYRDQILALLPSGAALDIEEGSPLRGLVEAFADTFVGAHNRSLDLVEESDPSAALELLSDWERIAGLPDDCTSNANTIPERRAAVVTRLTSRGGQSIAYFLSIATSLGYEDVVIEETRPFRCGASHCGRDALRGGAINRHRWKVTVRNARITRFRCGTGRCGIDPLAKISRAEDLECLLHRLKPAHSELIVGYEGV